jgi:hypothetical protein
MLIFLLTFIFHRRGYVYLGQEYDLPVLRWKTYGFILTVVALVVANVADVYVESIGAHGIIGVSAVLYVAGFVGLGFGTLALKERDFTNEWLEKAVGKHCTMPTQYRSNPVSAQNLRKTGIFAEVARDFRQVAPQNWGIGSLETETNPRKAGISGPISRFPGCLANCRNAWLATQCTPHPSPRKFPANREFTGEKHDFGPPGSDLKA